MQQQEILIRSSIDGTDQPSLFYKAKEDGRPLLVGLHTWSFDRFNQVNNLLPLAKKHNFNLLLPQFRGPNLISNEDPTKACGSDEAVSDIVDAINYVIAEYSCDKDHVLLLGNSGGGHMALLMAGRHPELFFATAAFVPITNLEDWCAENANYAPHVLACCKNDTKEMAYRSPITYLAGLARANVKIFHGKYDPVVPVSQSINLYNEMQKKYPSSRVFLDVFDGGHDLDIHAAEYWFMTQLEKLEKIAVTG